MRNLLKIFRSIVIKNKGFSICLLLMSMLSIIMCFAAVNLSLSSEKSIANFLEYSGTPDGLIETTFLNEKEFEFIKDFEEIEQFTVRSIIDINIETENNKQFASRLHSYNEDGPYKLEIHEKTFLPDDVIKVMISYEFAEFHNINTGDYISLSTYFGTFNACVEATVSSAETMDCIKDDFSQYENTQFSYLYMTNYEFEKAFGQYVPVNSVFIYFNDGVSVEKQKEVLKDIENQLCDKITYCIYVSESEAITKMYDDIDSIRSMCYFMASIILTMTLGFSFIFLKIIIDGQKNLIVLLRSLGYTSKKTGFIFIFYIFVIDFVATLLAIPIGYFITKKLVTLLVSANGILTTVLSISTWLTIGAILLVFAVGALAGLLASRSINKLDPSLMISQSQYNKDTPKFIQNMNCTPYTKISLISIWRKLSRMIIGFLCVGACIINMTVGFEGYSSASYTSKAVFTERLQYDLMVRQINNDDYTNIKNTIQNVEIIEPLTMFMGSVADKNIKISTIIEDSQLIKLKNVNNEIIFPKDGIIVDEMYSIMNNVNVGDNISISGINLIVTGVAREIGYPFFYVSPQVAEKVFHKSTNGALIKLNNQSKIEDTIKDIKNIDSNFYCINKLMQFDYMESRYVPPRIVMLLFASLAFLIGSLFIFNISFIDFNEKKKDYAIMRALGTSVNKICIVSIIENLPRIFFGIIISIPLSYLCSNALLKLLSMPTLQYVSVHFWGCLFISILISLLYIVISFFVSRRAIKKMKFVEILSEMEQ